jgi:hypothetical protein
MLMFGLSQAGGGASVTYAGDEDVCVTFTPTRTNTRTPTGTPPTATNTTVPPTSTPVPPTSTATSAPLTFNDAPGDNLSAFGNETPQRTCEATETNTPTRTNTPAPGVTNTVAPPVTNTPTGGTQGGGVQPPNTGFGDTGSDSSSSLWFLLAGVALVATGTGAIVAGARRRD